VGGDGVIKVYRLAETPRKYPYGCPAYVVGRRKCVPIGKLGRPCPPYLGTDHPSLSPVQTQSCPQCGVSCQYHFSPQWRNLLFQNTLLNPNRQPIVHHVCILPGTRWLSRFTRTCTWKGDIHDIEVVRVE